MIWNPWKALSAAQQEVTRLRGVIAERDEAEAQLESKSSEMQLRVKIAETTISNLLKEIARGHFRNPKTGRLGRKGERFK